MKLPTFAYALGVAAILAGPVPVLAQQAPPQPSRPSHAATSDAFASRVQQHIERLRTQLKITSEQGTQWQQFAQVMQQNARNMHEAIDQRGAALGTMNAAQDMQSYAHLAQVHAEDMQRLSAAFQTLYDSMSPAQRQNADTVFRAQDMNRAAQRRAAHG